MLDQFKFLLGNIASQSHSLQGKKISLRKENRSRDIFGDKVKKEVSRSSNWFFLSTVYVTIDQNWSRGYFDLSFTAAEISFLKTEQNCDRSISMHVYEDK